MAARFKQLVIFPAFGYNREKEAIGVARSENQKLKLLYLKQLFERQTDEQHPISMPQILTELEALGIRAERKSVYDDIACLQQFGMDIVRQPGPKGGYFLASREFELPELKLLVDAVQSSKFLSSKKSMDLIAKLATLTSVHEAGTLRRQVVVSGRVKSMNESVYYAVDRIHDAIARGRQIRFRYFDYGPDGMRRERPKDYLVSPYALIWSEENYYLVAHSPQHGLTHYRVDKMARISVTDTPRHMDEAVKQLDLSKYGSSVFGMFAGQPVTVKMRFASALAGVVIDRFGKDAMLIPDGPEHFTVTAEIAISPVFFGWMASFADRAKIVYPQAVAQEFLDFCRRAIEQYK